MIKTRTFKILGLVIAGVCLLRVFSVAAANRDDDVETYAATEGSQDSASTTADTSQDGDSDGQQADIKLATPEEAAADVAQDGSSADLVPGVDRLRNREQAENTLIVPTRMGRKIAAQAPPPLPPEEPSPIDVRPEAMGAASAAPTSGQLSAAPLNPEVMEPRSRPFTSADARARSSELRSESLVASNSDSSRSSLGIHSEPGPQTRYETPTPDSAKMARTGVQEISVIVSDYGYFPNRLFVTQGVPVKIFLTTPSKVTMCFMQDTWSVKKGVTPGRIEEVTFVPDQPGNYRFYCPVKSIEGTITVREPVVDQPAQRAVASAPEEPRAGHSNEPKRAAELRSLIED